MRLVPDVSAFFIEHHKLLLVIMVVMVKEHSQMESLQKHYHLLWIIEKLKLNTMYITISLLIVVIIMVISISKWKVNPFLAILSASFILAILIKIPLLEIPNIISASFASTFGSIGLIIIFGALIGVMLEESGAALKISDMLIKALGERYPKLTMMLIGWIVSIPVFCDSGFILLTPISKSLWSRTGVSKLKMSVA